MCHAPPRLTEELASTEVPDWPDLKENGCKQRGDGKPAAPELRDTLTESHFEQSRGVCAAGGLVLLDITARISDFETTIAVLTLPA
jgi:hypothetical protein